MCIIVLIHYYNKTKYDFGFHANSFIIKKVHGGGSINSRPISVNTQLACFFLRLQYLPHHILHTCKHINYLVSQYPTSYKWGKKVVNNM